MTKAAETELLYDLTENVKTLLEAFQIKDSRAMICAAMMQFPDAAQPHNLYGILLEMQQDHIAAMKHFRAAACLDPTFLPARKNMESLGSFHKTPGFAFTRQDCEGAAQKERFKVEYDANGMGHIVRRRTNEYF